MTTAGWAFAGLVWLTVAAGSIAWILSRAPRKSKPLDRDALEAADAALRLRVADVEDRFERHIKRDAVRAGREKAADEAAQGVLPLDRAARLSAARTRAKAQGLI